MKKKRNQEQAEKPRKSTLKSITAAAVLAGTMLVSTQAEAKAAASDPAKGSLQQRVGLVREALLRKLSQRETAGADSGKLSYSEMRVVGEWPNWGNWGNWANWNNWRDWNNWNNWTKWGDAWTKFLNK